MKMRLELVSAGKYLRYKVSVDDTICGYLDFTQRESDMFRFVLNEGVKSLMDHEFEVEYAFINPSIAVYVEGA